MIAMDTAGAGAMLTCLKQYTRRTWLLMLAVLIMLTAPFGAALAAITVTAVTVNGGPTTNVQTNADITITVTVRLTGNSDWRSTSFTTTPGSGLSWCYFSPFINSNGTYTRSFTVPAPATAGTFSLNVRAYTRSECSGTVSQVRTLPNAIVTGAPPPALNHVRILHDGNAQTCGVEPVSLRACANAACTTLYTGNVVLALGAGAGTWSTNPVTISNGNATVNLSNTNSGTVALSGTVSSPAATNGSAVCYRGSTAGECAMVFSNSSCNFDAVEPSSGPTTSIFTRRIGVNVALDVLSLIGGAINPSSTATIAATLVAGSATGCTTTALSPTVTFTMNGANAGRRLVTFVPDKAARNVRVRMVSGSTVGCSSDNFAIRPASLTLSASGVGVDAAGASVSSAIPTLKAASTTFTLSATASAGYDAAPVINQNMVQSSSAYAGEVGGAFGAANSATGQAQGNAFTYSEVGYFRFGPYAIYDDDFADVDASKSPADCNVDSNLGTDTAPADPNLLSSGKIGCYFGAGATSYFGRFIPHSFAVSDGAIVNRSANPACVAPIESTFSYMGEAMTPGFTLTAVNGLGAATQNYDGDFERINLLTSLGLGAINAPGSGARTPFPVCGALAAHPCMTPGVVEGSFAEGEALVKAPLTVFRDTTAVGPFADFKVGVAPVDLDGVKIGTFDIDTASTTAGPNNHALVDATIVRYGRMGVDNAHGSELLNLTMKLAAQYWTGTAFVVNTLDSCTVPALKAFAALDYKGGINATNMPFAKLTASPLLVNGVGSMMLAKPGPTPPTAKGSVTIRSALPYLPGSSRATFGIYKAGPVIHVRETY